MVTFRNIATNARQTEYGTPQRNEDGRAASAVPISFDVCGTHYDVEAGGTAEIPDEHVPFVEARINNGLRMRRQP